MLLRSWQIHTIELQAGSMGVGVHAASCVGGGDLNDWQPEYATKL